MRERKQEKCATTSSTNNLGSLDARSTSVNLDASVTVDNTDEFFLMHSLCLSSLLNNVLCSSCCQNTVSAKITERYGLSVKIVLVCKNCECILGDNFTSPRLESQSKRQSAFVVNRKAVEATNNIGIGNAALEKFCKNLNIRPMASRSYQLHLNSITEEAILLENKVLSEARLAVRKAYVERDASLANKKIIDIATSYDGTWHKRGHTSLYGVGIAVDMLTGLVVDFDILSKYCHMCSVTSAELDIDSPEYDVWYQSHKDSQECNINYTGSSGSMEVHAAVKIWSRSVQKNSMRYTTILSDGDARTWTQLNELAPYGSSVHIIKEECINHVHKRMGKGLRDLAQKERLGGKKEGALTAATIKLLSKYYRRAIINNLKNVQQMQQAVKATLFHCSSTDEQPNHELCPKGSSSWCFYNKAIALSLEPRSHNQMQVKLNNKVFKMLLPLYERLSQPALLERCIRGGTQNINESLHAQIWRRCPKEVFVSRKRIHVAVVNAIMERNCGILGSQQVKASLRNERISQINLEVSRRMDTARSKRKVAQEEYRHSKRLKRTAVARKKHQAKSKDYGAGEH